MLDSALALWGKEVDIVREKNCKLSNVSNLVKIRLEHANSRIKFFSQEIKNTTKYM